MASEPRIEMLDGGIVNSRDRSTLPPGSLTRAKNCFYRPHDPALWKHPGRVAYDTLATTPGTISVVGLRYLEFDKTTAQLVKVKKSGGGFALSTSAFTAETGTWSDFADAIGAATGLDSIYYLDKYILLIGAPTTTGNLIGNNLVMRSDAIVRRQGLAPVVSTPGAALVAGGWPNSATFPLGWYAFITTEVHDAEGTDELESSWEGEHAAMINVNDVAKSVQITFPTLVNAGKMSDGSNLINKRRVYMAGPVGGIDPVPTSQPSDPPLSEYRLVAEQSVADGTVVIGTTNLANGRLPGTAAGWTNPNNIKVDDNVGATHSGNTLDLLKATNYGFANAGTVVGVAVEVKMKRSANIPLTLPKVQLTKDGTNPVGSSQNVPFVQIGAPNLVFDTDYHVFTMGGPTETWGAALTAADTNAATFGVLLTNGTFPFGTGSWDVDYIRVYVYTAGGGSDIPIGQDFPIVSIPIAGGSTVLYPSHSQPPPSSTGDVFQGQVVQNDVNNPGEIVWSLPLKPEYFPGPYRMRLDSKRHDEVVCIRTMGEVVLIGTKDGLWRVPRLPSEVDSFYDTGPVKEKFCPDKGVVSAQAIAAFTTPGGPTMAAFVSPNGIHYTDGFHVDTLIRDIDWYNMVNPDKLNLSTLINYPKRSTLEFSYIPFGDNTSTRPTKRLILHYHPSQRVEGGKLKVTGPIDLDSICGDVARLNGQDVYLTGHDNGAVYVEDRGWQDAANDNVNLIMDVVTRDIYPAGVGYEATVERTWWRHGKFDTPEIILTITPWVKKSGGDYFTPAAGPRWTGKARNAAAGAPLPDDPSGPNNSGALERADTHFIAESFLYQMTTSSANQGYWLAFVAYQIAGRGPSDNPG